MITPSRHIYTCAGSPDVENVDIVDTICATCAQKINAGVSITKIENPAFSQHADYLRYSKYVCTDDSRAVARMARRIPGSF